MTKQIEIKVPDIGDFSDIPVIEVLVAVGDSVEAEQSLLTLESDKAMMEVPAPVAGVIRELRVVVGDKVSEDQVVAIIEAEEVAESQPPEAASAPAPDALQAPAASAPQAAPVPQPAAGRAAPAPPSVGSRQSPPVPMGASATLPANIPYASPAVRRFARELGVDLLQIAGSGRAGRIVHDDVTAFVKSIMTGAVKPAAGGLGFDLPPQPKVNFARYGEIELRPISKIQKVSGAYLHRNWVSIPHVTQNDLADITDMEVYRKTQAQEKGVKLTPLVFLIKASVAALKKFPAFNASLDITRENLVLKKYFHIGIAVDTPDGLVVPVIRDCDQKDIFQLAAELGELSQRARDGKLKPVEMQGGCFSISSLGGIGGTSFTPIINAPEVAILGVSRSSMQPQWDGESFQPRMMLPLCLSYDHRVIDGANGARFTRYLATCLEDFGNMEL
ncbi:MAG TPA: dihydrolipoyllysine-residue acetyltransferase [Xanthomonadales bacterium]